MLDVFEDASRGQYQRTVVTTSESKSSKHNSSGFRMEFKNGQPVVKGTYLLVMLIIINNVIPYRYLYNY